MRSPLRPTQGFTLIEVLLVIAVVGILLGIGWATYTRAIQSNQLTEQANRLARDLSGARSAAQRQSQNMRLILTANGYSVGPVGGTAAPSVLENGVTLSCTVNCNGELVYQAPFATLNGATGRVYQLRSPNASLPPVEVRVVGVTGKVSVVRGGS